MKRLLPALGLIIVLSICSFGDPLTVIGHRGASGYLPEHTLESYALAYGLGADYIELDLVMTSDGVLICLHDIYLESTTDVESVFSDRNRNDGHWYAADFSLSEIRQLHVHERCRSQDVPYFQGRFPVGQSSFQVPTLQEAVELVQGLNRSTKLNVGIYPELKRPGWHEGQGLPMGETVLSTLTNYGYDNTNDNIYVQCFEAEFLRTLHDELHTQLQLVQLVGSSWIYAVMLTDNGLDGVAEYADGIGPTKGIIESNPKIVQMAHDRGLVVHPYTFRQDALPSSYSSLEQELIQFCQTYGVDGVFTDFIDIAVRVREQTAACQ